MSDEQDKLKLSLEPPRLFGRKKKSAPTASDAAEPTPAAKKPAAPKAPADKPTKKTAEPPATQAPTATAPTETAPAETAPTETAPAETAPAETAPTEKAPAEIPPEKKPAAQPTQGEEPTTEDPEQATDAATTGEEATRWAPPAEEATTPPADRPAPAKKATPAKKAPPAKKAAPAKKAPAAKKAAAATKASVAATKAPAAAPVSEPVRRPTPEPVPEVVPAPVGLDRAEREDAEIAARLADEAPLLPLYPAAAVTGGIVGGAMVLLTWLSLRGCESVRGTASCGGGPGFLLLVATFVVCVLLGSALLRTFSVPDPGSTSFLAVGLVAVVALLFLIDVLDTWPMLIVIPLIAVAAFLTSVWVTKTFVEPDAESG